MNDDWRKLILRYIAILTFAGWRAAGMVGGKVLGEGKWVHPSSGNLNRGILGRRKEGGVE
jgi:hypothetical protein